MTWKKSLRSLVEAFDLALPRALGITRRTMFGCPSAMADGRLFAGVFQSDIFLRVPPDRQSELFAGDEPVHFEPLAGRPMRSYVVLPVRIAGDRYALAEWLQVSAEYARGLPAPPRRKARSKPTKVAKKGAAKKPTRRVKKASAARAPRKKRAASKGLPGRRP
jgi:hypothetical protein